MVIEIKIKVNVEGKVHTSVREDTCNKLICLLSGGRGQEGLIKVKGLVCVDVIVNIFSFFYGTLCSDQLFRILEKQKQNVLFVSGKHLSMNLPHLFCT